MANVGAGFRSFRPLHEEERPFYFVPLREARAAASKKFTGSKAGWSDGKGVVRLVTGREFSFLDERCALCPTRSDASRMEGDPAEDASTQNVQVGERREKDTAIETHVT